jgi:hypothetical protein
MTPDPPVLAVSTQALIALCDAHLVRGDWPAALAAARAAVRKDSGDASRTTCRRHQGAHR